MPQRDLRVLVRQRDTELSRIDLTEDGLDVAHAQRCYAVATVPGWLAGISLRRPPGAIDARATLTRCA
jgi:hypothetical protein